MVQTVFSSKVAWGTKVKIIANTARPPNPRNARLAARITDDVGMKIAYKGYICSTLSFSNTLIGALYMDTFDQVYTGTRLTSLIFENLARNLSSHSKSSQYFS